jgi:hypothetical protein
MQNVLLKSLNLNSYLLHEFWIATKGPRLELASMKISGIKPFGFKGINSHIYGGGLCKVPNISPYVGNIHMKQQPISSQLINT